MRIGMKCGIVTLGYLDDFAGPGVLLRTSEGDEISLPLTREEAQSLGKEAPLFSNLTLTITLEAES